MKQSNNRLYFRAFEYDDLMFINELRKEEFSYDLTCGTKYYVSSERDKKWIEEKINDNYKQLYLMIVKKEDNQPIGYIGVVDLDYINRKAMLRSIILKKELSGQGYGTESNFLIVKHLFTELGMNMIYTLVREDNIASIRALEKINFQKDGLIRNFIYRQNKFHNVYIVTLLKSEFDREESGEPQDEYGAL